MRNLQKILALVLALVMSLSLMATAGAREFTDGDQIDETFAESVDVLTGLEVFQGYPTGDFQPKGDITRAEVAAIIYRIATGDVTDSQVGIYADYNKFSDVPSDNWAAGYINYCANAEYIKGRGDGKFYPQDKVTGYEALAMILRVVGYDKNGEFTGADWQVQTAATANQRKVTQNVNAGTLGTAATRETVAELLCKAILIEKVNYTLAFGYQISTDPKDTIAYETFKMEKLEGVVTGNEIADLKTDKGTALGANQTRLVIDGREEVMNIPTGLDDIGECVRVYIRPENGTTRSNLVTENVYSEDLNKVFTTSERLSSVGNSTGSEEGITSIEGAEHFINFDQAHKWEARSVIRYTIDVRMSEYDARVMYWQNGTSSNSRLTGMANTVYAAQNDSGVNSNEYIGRKDINENWDKLIRTASGATYTYTKTIDAFTNLTDQDYANIRAIFTNANYTNANGIVKGEVYVGTSSITHTDDVSDDIRWEDFVATYLKSEDNKDQIDSNGQGYLLKIIDNDMDGIAEYVLQTRYTVAKVAANGTGLDIAALRFTDDDTCNEVSASDKITVVSGTNLETSEDTVAAGDVVIYAMIDGVVRAQKAESETSRVTTINRTVTPVTATIESGEKKQSAVHEHSEGLASGLTGMVIGTNYTVYYDLFGNIAAYQEGDVGQFVLITDGWFNQTATAREYAVQAYIDGKLQTVNITNNGQLFIDTRNINNNTWGRLKTTFGNGNGDINHDGGDYLNTIVANLEGNNLVPVDKSYLVNRSVRMFALPDKSEGIPTRDNGVKGQSYETLYGLDATAYQDAKGEATIYGRSDTVYYYVWKDGTTNTVTGQPNMVVQTYTGFANIPSINSLYIEDVYAVGSLTHSNTGSVTPNPVYTADVVVVELNKDYKYTNTNREQVFIPGAAVVNNTTARVAGYGIETVPMIRGNGEYQTDVQVNLTYSKGYNSVDGRGYIAGGLYFLDPMDNDPSVYTITKMTHADIRANNYLTGYVDLSTVLENNWVAVDVQMENGYDANNNPNAPVDSSLGTVGKTVNTENLYKLSFRNLTKVPAAEAFNQWPDIHKSNTNINPLNELCDWNDATRTGTINTTKSNRNEVLVRYNGGNVVWAVSFEEFDGTGMNPAQTVWYQNLVANDTRVTSGAKFFGVAVGDSKNQASHDKDSNGDWHITVNYADAEMNPVIDLTSLNVNGVTVKSYSLTRWNDATGYTVSNVEGDQKTIAQNGDVKYKLVVNFVSGGSETYYLILKAANNDVTVNPPEGADVDNALKRMTVSDVGMTIQQFIDRVVAANPGKAIDGWKFKNNTTGLDITDYKNGQMSTVGEFSFTVTSESGESVLFSGVTAVASEELQDVNEMKDRVTDKVANSGESSQMKTILSGAYSKYQQALAAAGSDTTKINTAKRELQAALNIVDSLVELVNYPAFNIHTQGINKDGTEITQALEQFGRHFGIGNASTGAVTLGGRVPELVAFDSGVKVDCYAAQYDAVGNLIYGKMKINLKSTGETSNTVDTSLSTITESFEWEWKLPVDSIFGTPDEVAETVKPVAETRPAYTAAYKTAGLTAEIAGKTVNVTIDGTALNKLAVKAYLANPATATEEAIKNAIITMQPSDPTSNKNLHYGVAFGAPAMATSVDIVVKKNGTVVAGSGTPVNVSKDAVDPSTGLAFTDGVVRDYIPVVKVDASGNPTVIDADETWTYELQFKYNTLSLGEKQVITVNVKAPVAAAE